MKKKNLRVDYVFDLINAFKSIKSTDESVLFLQDILTAGEIKNLSIRLRIARLLLSGKNQRNISMNLNVSIATVSKVNSWLTQRGEGFKKIIARLPIKYNLPTKTVKGPLEYHLPEVLSTSIQYLAANQQNKKVSKLIETVINKKSSDEILKEPASEFYKYTPKKH